MNSGRCGCASAGTIAGGQQQNMERGVEIARGLVGEGGDHRLLIPNADHPSAVGILHPRLDGPFLHPCGRVWYRREIVRFDDATPRSPRTSGSSPGVVAGRVLGSAVEVAVSVSRDGLARRPVCIQLVSRPQSRGGCRPRSHGGSQQPDGFPGPSGVSAGRGLLSFRGDVRDERRPGHQIECGIFQYRDLGGRHTAQRHHFGARRQSLACQEQEFRAEMFGRQGIAPNPLSQ